MIGYLESFSEWYYRTEADELSLANIEEKFGTDAIPDRRRNPAQLVECSSITENIIGLVKSLKNPYVLFVGEVDDSVRMALGNTTIIETRCTYIPEVLITLRERTHIEIDTIYSQNNSARFSEQITSLNEKLDKNAKFFIDFAVERK